MKSFMQYMHGGAIGAAAFSMWNWRPAVTLAKLG